MVVWYRRCAIAALAALIALVAAATPQPARAEWRSLSGLLPAYVGRVDYEISPDSQYVAYVADIDADDVNELYIAPIAGGAPLKLNPPLAAGGNVSTILFSPDSSHVIYRADQEVDERVELWSVPIGGGQAVKLNGALAAGGNVSSFKIDAKNGRVVYVADQQTNDVNELWSVPLTGGAPVKLNAPLVAGGDVGIYATDPLSNRVVYSADQEIDGTYELYSVPVLGGAVVKLSPPIALIGGGDSGIYSEWALDPIIPVVVFMANNEGTGKKNVLMVPTAGGVAPTKLNFNLLATQRILGFRISPAGDRVVFNVGTRSGSTNASKGNLYSALIGGGGAADLTEPADPLFGVDSFQFTPDGQRVVYGYQKNAAATVRLESSVVTSGVRAALYTPSASDPPFAFFRLSGDSQWVAYFATNSASLYNLYTIPPGGGSAVSHGPVQSALITPDSGRVLFSSVTGGDNKTDLFSEQIFGGDRRNLSGTEGAGYVGDIETSPDNKAVVFLAQIDSRYDLRVSDGKAAQPPTTPTLTPTLTTVPTISPQPTASPTPQAGPPLVRRVFLPVVRQ